MVRRKTIELLAGNDRCGSCESTPEIIISNAANATYWLARQLVSKMLRICIFAERHALLRMSAKAAPEGHKASQKVGLLD